MKKQEAEAAIRHLATRWRRESGLAADAMPSFSDFQTWLSANGFSGCLDYRSVMGALSDAEAWFDDELGQNWRN
jgi:hypothetical protein